MAWAGVGLEQGSGDARDMFIVLLGGFHEGLNVSNYEGVVGLLEFCGCVGGSYCMGVDRVTHSF